MHVHELRNDSILCQVVCAASGNKYSMVLSSRYLDASVVYRGNKNSTAVIDVTLYVIHRIVNR